VEEIGIAIDGMLCRQFLEGENLSFNLQHMFFTPKGRVREIVVHIAK
jgi:hypothetical protein